MSKAMNSRLLILPFLFVLLALAGCESPEERAAGHFAKAQELFAEENYIKAELEVLNALQIEPKNADARFLLAQIAETRLDYPEMASQLRAAIESRPDFLEARLKLAELYIFGGAPDEADAQYQEAVKIAPEDPGVIVLEASLLATRGELEQAGERLQVVLEKDPANARALGLLARVVAADDPQAALDIVDRGIAATDDNEALRGLRIQLLQITGDMDGMIEEYRALIRDFPERDQYSYLLARVLTVEGRADESEQVLRELIVRNPDSSEPKLVLLQFISLNEGPEAALKQLESFVAEAPDQYDLGLALGNAYQLTGEQEKAVAAYEDVVEKAGNNDEALTAKARLAAIALTSDDDERGEAIIEEILAVDSMNADALLLRGAVGYEQGNLNDAVSDLRSVLRSAPDNIRAQLLLARTHAKADEGLLAKDAYLRVLEMDPNNAVVPLELARLLVAQNELDEAQAILETRLENSPEDINASRTLIALLINMKRYRDAEDEAQRVAAIEGQEAVGEYLLGSVYQVTEDNNKALAAFEKSLTAQPNTREPLQGVVSSLVRLDRSDEAVSRLETIIAENPDNLFAQTLLGQVLAGSGETDAARDLMESTLSTNEGWLPAYTTLAGLQSGDVNAQIDIYKRGLEAIPDSQELALLLGSAFQQQGEIDQAIAAYEQVLESAPDSSAVANNLAALIADYRTDTASLNRALELAKPLESSGNPAYLDTLGWVYYRLGEYDEAVPLLEESVRLAGQVPVLRYHLGMAYLAQDKLTLAEEELAAATENPDIEYMGRDEAVRALQEIRGGN